MWFIYCLATRLTTLIARAAGGAVIIDTRVLDIGIIPARKVQGAPIHDGQNLNSCTALLHLQRACPGQYALTKFLMVFSG